MQCCLDGTKVTRAETLVQPAQPFLAEHLSHAVETVLVSATPRSRLRLVQLQSCLDQPDRIGSCRRGYSGRNGRLCMDECRVFAVSQHMRADALAVAVDVEFDRGRWDHASETGSQTSKEGPPAFGAIDVAYYSDGLVACAEGTIGRRGGGGGRLLIEVGL